jgi:hypothetical protein
VTEPTNTGPDEPATSEPTATGPHETAASEPIKTEEPRVTERARTKHSAPQGPGSAVRWLGALALVVALVALGVGGWVLYRAGWTGTGRLATAPATTTSPAPPGPSPQQVADAKTKACGAYDTVAKAVNVRTNASIGPDPAAALSEAVQANARLTLSTGYTYLLAHLDAATPPALADAIRKFAENIEEVSIYSLSGVGTEDPAQADRLKEWSPLNDQITDLCK